jgi:transposase
MPPAWPAGRAKAIIPDNLKSAIGKACWFEPTINRTYADLAVHYGTAILPARPRKPRDKAKVEAVVQVVERWILAKLRNRRFHSLAPPSTMPSSSWSRSSIGTLTASWQEPPRALP